MPLSGAPVLGVLALAGAFGVVVAVLVVGLLTVVVVVRWVVAGACVAAESLLLFLSEPQAPTSSARATIATGAIRFMAS